MRIALAQINPTLGDFKKNAEKIIEFSKRAKEKNADMVVFPESTLFGYHPMDLLERPTIVKEQLKYLKVLSKKLPRDMACVFGAFTNNEGKKGKPYFNSALIYLNGKQVFSCAKELLPTYNVFDDARHIEPGDMKKNIFRFKGKKIFVTVCEDIWAWPVKGHQLESYYPSNPIKKIKPGQADLVINLSASPFFVGKFKKRKVITQMTAKYVKAPMCYVNMVGSQDELIFDGGSFVIDPSGKILAQSLFFEEDLNLFDLETKNGGFRKQTLKPIELKRQALILGVRDFCDKIGMSHAHLGLSGGIDSALVAALAVDALGPQNVKAFYLPGPYSSPESQSLASRLAKNLGIALSEIRIGKGFEAVTEEYYKVMGKSEFGLMEENIQARLRSMMLMAYANREGGLLLNTSNKTELATGFGTLYGDLAGGLCVIGDLLKRDVYEMSKLYNVEHEVIPEEILKRAPTAELKPNQKDEDRLPPYGELDPAVVTLVERYKAPKDKTDRFLLDAMMKSEFKRWQAPPILKVRAHSFGRGRRMPVAHRAFF